MQKLAGGEGVVQDGNGIMHLKMTKQFSYNFQLMKLFLKEDSKCLTPPRENPTKLCV